VHQAAGQLSWAEAGKVEQAGKPAFDRLEYVLGIGQQEV
jgi:hypothetical protein